MIAFLGKGNLNTLIHILIDSILLMQSILI